MGDAENAAKKFCAKEPFLFYSRGPILYSGGGMIHQLFIDRRNRGYGWVCPTRIFLSSLPAYEGLGAPA